MVCPFETLQIISRTCIANLENFVVVKGFVAPIGACAFKYTTHFILEIIPLQFRMLRWK